jgi:hypothetical protein
MIAGDHGSELDAVGVGEQRVAGDQRVLADDEHGLAVDVEPAQQRVHP